MKLAIPTEGDEVFGHFGQCRVFTMAVIEDGKVIEKNLYESPGHEGGLLPAKLMEQGVTHVVTGGMGPKAVENFRAGGIEVYLGVTGKVDDVIAEFIAGNLQSGGSVCQEHQH